MIRSGIVPIDELCGGFRPRSTYLLTGGAGAGKSTCSLHFANQGLRSGEKIAMLTHASCDDLLAHADHLGIDLRLALREERALIVRYRSDFARRLARAGSADPMLTDLRRLLVEFRPRRIVIDTFAPLIEDGSSSPLAASSLAELLETSQSTALLTYPDDLSGGYDRRLEPLVQSAAGVFRLRHDGDGARLDVVSLRHVSSSTPTTMRLGASVAPNDALPDEALVGGARPLLLLHVSDDATDDVLATLRLQHEVVVRASEEADGEPADATFAALIVETDHATLDRARRLVRSRQGPSAAPIVVVTRFNLRSLDRARLLRDGADEVLAGDMGAPELLQRLAAALRRGHLDRPPLAVHEDEGLTQAALTAPGALLDRDRFAAALRERSAHDDAVPFTVVRLTTETGGRDETHALGRLVLTGMRAASGDLAALLDEGIAVYLHGARRRDVAPFLDRLRVRRPIGASALRIASASFPADGAAVRQLVEPLEVS
jgi:KaiC/GvpD/RAD55 family RecA-like ATPase/DNA-binding response OmpR family regulator